MYQAVVLKLTHTASAGIWWKVRNRLWVLEPPLFLAPCPIGNWLWVLNSDSPMGGDPALVYLLWWWKMRDFNQQFAFLWMIILDVERFEPPGDAYLVVLPRHRDLRLLHIIYWRTIYDSRFARIASLNLIHISISFLVTNVVLAKTCE